MTKIPLKAAGYKLSDLCSTRFVECRMCKETVVQASTHAKPFDTLILDPELTDDKEYNLHVCPGSCPNC